MSEAKFGNERLRHFNFHGLKLMVTQNMVVGLPKAFPSNVFCKGCVLGKHHQEPFDSENAWHVSNPLDLVHSNPCCISKPSLACARYALEFINDLFCFTWFYFLKNKSHVFEIFKDFMELVENQSSRLVKCEILQWWRVCELTV